MPNRIVSTAYYTLENGVRVRMQSVPAFLLERIQNAIPLPKVPLWKNPETGDEIENPTDPTYVQAVQEAEAKRMSHAMMAATIFGLKIVDSDGKDADPPNDGWEIKLTFLGIDWRNPLGSDISALDGIDLSFAREASYLLYSGMSTKDLEYLMPKLIGSEAYQTAVDTFPGDETRNADSAVSA